MGKAELAIVDDDEFAAPFIAEGEGGPPQQIAISSGRGRPRGGGRGRGRAATILLICIVPECECARAANSKFCKPHHGSWNAMELQHEDEDEEAQAILAELKARGNEEDRGRAVFNFCLVNPADQKYVKKRFFELIQYHKTCFTATQRTDKQGEKPMTQAAFFKYCDSELGLTPDEMKSWWEELHDDPRTERDNGGFRGREQLWIPLGASRSRDRIKGITDSVTESSGVQKKFKKKDRDLFLDHLGKQRTSLADAFINDPAEQLRKGLKRKQAGKDGEEGEGAKSEVAQPPRKRKKTFDADNDGPKYFQEMQTALEKVDYKFILMEKAYSKAFEELQKVPEDAKVRDPAMLGYVRKFQFRHQLAMKFKGSDTVTKLFNTYQKEGDPSPTHSLFPHDDVMAPGTPTQARSRHVVQSSKYHR